MPTTVKAVVMTAPGKIEVQQLPYPKLERGALVLKMQMSGICGTDKHAYKGEKVLYGGTEAEQEIVYPTVHGHENVGTVVEIFNEDRRLIEYHGQELKEGDRVTMCPNVICGHCWYCRHIFAYPFCAENTTIGLSYPSNKPPYVVGGWAEYMFVPPKAWVYKVPEGLPDELGALAEIFVVSATLDRAKEFSRLEARGFGFADTVAVQGAGAMGCMHIAKARMLGAGQIIVLDESDDKMRLAREFGADVTVNVRDVPHAERVKIIKDLTEGRGADVVVETAGNAQAFVEGLDYTRRGGTYIETGSFVDTGEVPVNVHRHIAAKNVLLIGNSNHPHTGYYQAMKMMLKYRKEYPFEKLITHRFSLDQGQEAMDRSFDPECLKVVFVP
jgi:threonine dehydrogenase-like Zn-dependent dehydrogenase